MVGKILVQRSPQRSLIPHDNVVQALASDGAHQPFCKGILQGDRRSKHFFLDSRGPRQMTRQEGSPVWEGGLRGRGKYLSTVRGLRHRNR